MWPCLSVGWLVGWSVDLFVIISLKGTCYRSTCHNTTCCSDILTRFIDQQKNPCILLNKKYDDLLYYLKRRICFERCFDDMLLVVWPHNLRPHFIKLFPPKHAMHSEVGKKDFQRKSKENPPLDKKRSTIYKRRKKATLSITEKSESRKKEKTPPCRPRCRPRKKCFILFFNINSSSVLWIQKNNADRSVNSFFRANEPSLYFTFSCLHLYFIGTFVRNIVTI